MSKIIKIISLVILTPIIIFGLYIIAHGHLTPGGGFQGGVIIATGIATILIAFREIKISKGLLSLFESLGLTFFILLAFFGVLKTTFFNNFLANSPAILGKTIPFGINQGFLNSGGVIPLMNLAVGAEVASALSIIVILMVRQNND